MTSSVTLRLAEPADEGFLLDVYAGTRADELALTDWDAQQKAAFVKMQFDAQRSYYATVYPRMETWVVVRQGRDIGRMLLAWLECELRLVDLALLPAERNQGVGRGLLRDLMQEAAQAGVPLSLHVEPFNPALRLYQRQGFVKRSEHGIYWLMEWRPA